MGLVDGVASMAGNLVDKVKDVVGRAINAAKSLLHIASPSKVFRSIGNYTMLGLIVGINGQSGRVIDSVSRVASGMVNAFSPNFETTNIPNLTGSFSGINGNINTMVQHSHTVDINPRMKTVRIEMNVDNDALTSIVNDRNA